MLEGLAPDVRNRVLGLAVRNRLSTGQFLWHEGDRASAVHLIESGRLAIEVTSFDGFVSMLAVMGPGEVVGEQALVDPRNRRTGSVRALGPATTLSVTAEQFDDLRTRFPSVDRFLVQVLASRVERLSAQVLEANYDGVDNRVNRRLSVLVSAYREPDRDGAVSIAITQDGLARMAGSTRSSVNRHLRSLEEKGVIELARGRVIVHQPDALT